VKWATWEPGTFYDVGDIIVDSEDLVREWREAAERATSEVIGVKPADAPIEYIKAGPPECQLCGRAAELTEDKKHFCGRCGVWVTSE
jgi:ribosomal protein S27AE